MSRNSQEHGSFLLPTSAVAPFRAKVKAALDRERVETLAQAHQVWEAFTAAKARARAGGKRPKQTEVYERVVGDHMRRLGQTSPRFVNQRVLHDLLDAHRQKPVKVKQQELNVLLPPVGARWKELSQDTLYVTLDGRTLTWEVPYGNRGMENAHDSALGMAVIGEFNRIEWTRGSGGYATGNDEYNRESEQLGGGGNYSTFSYGPRGKKVTGRCDRETYLAPPPFRAMRLNRSW